MFFAQSVGKYKEELKAALRSLAPDSSNMIVDLKTIIDNADVLSPAELYDSIKTWRSKASMELRGGPADIAFTQIKAKGFFEGGDSYKKKVASKLRELLILLEPPAKTADQRIKESKGTRRQSLGRNLQRILQEARTGENIMNRLTKIEAGLGLVDQAERNTKTRLKGILTKKKKRGFFNFLGGKNRNYEDMLRKNVASLSQELSQDKPPSANLITVHIAFTRHGESCANVMSAKGNKLDQIKYTDPELTLRGIDMARQKGKAIFKHESLEDEIESTNSFPVGSGANTGRVTSPRMSSPLPLPLPLGPPPFALFDRSWILGSSDLLRAQQTLYYIKESATSVSDRYVIPHIAEKNRGLFHQDNTPGSVADLQGTAWMGKQSEVNPLHYVAGDNQTFQKEQGSAYAEPKVFFKWVGKNLGALKAIMNENYLRMRSPEETAYAAHPYLMPAGYVPKKPDDTIKLFLVSHSHFMSDLTKTYFGNKIKFNNLDTFMLEVKYDQAGNIVEEPHAITNVGGVKLEFKIWPGPVIAEMTCESDKYAKSGCRKSVCLDDKTNEPVKREQPPPPPPGGGQLLDAYGGGARNKTARNNKMVRQRQSKRQRKQSKKQKGGASMPEGWYNNGAQGQGTTASVSDLAATNGWIRPPMVQTAGGSRKNNKRSKKNRRTVRFR
jgi:hypothetical protein